jgi:hypothetical protein
LKKPRARTGYRWPAFKTEPAVVIALAGLLVGRTAFAAAPEQAAVVVLEQSPREPVPERAIRAVERKIERNAGSSVLDGGTLARRIAGKVRNPPQAVDTQVACVLEREAAELLETVAFGQDDETIARGRAALRREKVRLVATNRSAPAARALADICLFVVRAQLHRSDVAAAKVQARECLRLAPDLQPSIQTHPPDVRTLVAAVRSESLGRLVVRVAAAPSRPCILYVQGRRAGVPPLEIELVPGTYALQADCGAPGLVHDLVVRSDRVTRMTIAPRLERALRLEQPAVLDADEGRNELQAEDLTRLAEWLVVRELWTLERRGGALRMTRWQRTTQGLVAASAIAERLEPAATLDKRMELAVGKALCAAGDCVPADRSASAPMPALGIALAGAGVSAMLGSWIAYTQYRGLDADLDRMNVRELRYEEALNERDTFRNVALVSTGTGSALFAAAAPFWLPVERKPPWWAWSTGAVGASAIGVGTTLWLNQSLEATDCPPNAADCTRKRSAVPLAPMLVTQGAGLLSVPLTFLIRGFARSEGEQLAVGISPYGFAIHGAH